MKEANLLKAMWPSGISPKDYERAARLVLSAGGDVAPASKRQDGATKEYPAASARTVERVMSLLESGPASAVEMAAALGLHYTTVHGVLRAKAKKHSTRPPASGVGMVTQVWCHPKHAAQSTP